MDETEKTIARIRDHKKQQTRMALAHAAAELALLEDSSHQRISAITKKAGVSQRTFHNYFDSREAAIVEFAALTAESLFADVRDLASASVYETVEAAVINGLQKNDDDPMSFYSLGLLSQKVDFLSFAANNPEAEKLRRDLFMRMTKVFPHIDHFDLASQLTAAAAVAQHALSFYYRYFHREGPEKAILLVRRAFDQFREQSSTEPIALPDELLQEIDLRD